MKSIRAIGFLSFVFAVFFSVKANAEIRFDPTTLTCPSVRVGEEVSCGDFALKNTNFLLSVKVQEIKIADTKNFTLDSSSCDGKTLGAGQSCPVTVKFKSQEGGGYFTQANAAYTYTGFSKVRRVSAPIYGQATFPIVRLSTHTAPFGNQTVNTRQRQYVKMENIGTDTLNITGMTIPLGSAFSSEDDCEGSLAAGSYCGILIYFEPTEEVEYSATLDIVDDAYDSPQQVRLSGKGIAEENPDVNIDKVYIDFGEVLLGSEGTDTVTLTSSGTVALMIDSIVGSGRPPFTLEHDCPINPDTLAPQAECSVDVKFSPTVAGAYSETVTVTDNATDSPQMIYISGKGVSPNATLTPALLDFGNQTVGKSSLPQEVILLNSGTSTLTITDISTADPTLFTQTNTCDATLAPKRTCRIWVTFSPAETSFIGSTLTVSSDDPGGASKTFLFGRGITGPDVDISPPLFDFGDTPVGSTSEQNNFVIKNTGEGNLTLSSITVNSDFLQENECPAILEEEESCEIETWFTPKAAGNFSGILSVVDDAEGSPHKAILTGYGIFSDLTILPASINFGDQTVSMPSLLQQVRLLNSGNETITIEGIAPWGSSFSQSNDCGETLAPSAYCTIGVRFTPETEEFLTGRIEITTSAAGSPHNVALTGTGISPDYPDLDISPNSWDFGQIIVGQESGEKEFTVKNTGLVDVSIYSIDANSEFAQRNDCPDTLASGETCTVFGGFAPEAAGQFTGYITIVDNTYSRYQRSALSGTGSHSGEIDVSISATTIDFGEVAPMTESPAQSIILTSAGTDPVTIGSIKIVGSEASDFSIQSNCDNRSLDVGKSCIINVVFKPIFSGIKTADIVLFDDAHDSPQTVALYGTGTDDSSGSCSLTRGGQVNASALAAVLFALLALALVSLRGHRRRSSARG